MSKFRNLFPESDAYAEAGLIPKLEKALILCEILQSSSSNNLFEFEETITSLSNHSCISVSGNDNCERDNKRNHFQVVKSRNWENVKL